MTGDSRYTVLIVDDVPQNIQLAATTLREKGYTVSFATSGREALERVLLVQPDVIVLDVMMPEMDGFEVCRQLKARPETASIPIIFVTALNDTESITRGFEVGGVDYVTKPFNAAELVARVHTHCTLHHLQRLLAEKNAVLEELMHTMEEQVAQRTEALHAALRRQQNFGQMSAALVALINHEFRTPMTVIQSSVEMMRYAEQLEPSQRWQMWEQVRERITSSLAAMQKQLDSIAMMIQLHTALLHEQPQTASPATIVREVAEKCAAEHGRSRDLYLDIEGVPDVAIMMPENFRVALRCLISNAFQYSLPSTPVMVRCSCDGNAITVTIDDEGPGIDPEEETSLFQWFKRGRAHSGIGKQHGLGLGLPLAKLAAETMMGSLWFERRFPRGTRFVLSVPFGQELMSAALESVPQGHLSNGLRQVAQ